MEISSAHHQTMANHEMEEMLGVYPKDHQQEQQRQDERKLKPPTDQILRCPRCDSTNTKFCYYNNYSLTQPRYFCKGCRRYWTQGGTLRNVPVGGGCRKNKRSSSSSSSKIKGTPPPRDQFITTNNSNSHFPNLPPQVSYDPNDLTLAFSGMQNHDHFFPPNPNPNHASAYVPNNTGLLDILRGGFLDTTARTNATTTGFGFHNLYYGYNGNANTEVETSAVSEEIMVPFEGTTTSQVGTCKGVDGGENKMVMGLPWQLNAAGDGEYWNGAAATNWHGLINTSLM